MENTGKLWKNTTQKRLNKAFNNVFLFDKPKVYLTCCKANKICF